MKKRQQFTDLNISVGQWLYNFFLLQVFFIIYSIRGLLIFGIFPALASIFNVFYKWIKFDYYDLDIRKEFTSFYKMNFWETNRLGYILTLIGLFLVVDLYISSRFIQSFLFHTVLVIFFIIWLSIFLYFYSIYARYDLSPMNYFKQSFFIAMGSINQTFATLLSVLLVIYLFSYFPFLFLFFGIPLFFGPVAWFTIQGMNQIEQKKQA